eukprot:10729039-Alexandrium_andersonii.AAC.1
MNNATKASPFQLWPTRPSTAWENPLNGSTFGTLWCHLPTTAAPHSRSNWHEPGLQGSSRWVQMLPVTVCACPGAVAAQGGYNRVFKRKANPDIRHAV